MMGTTILFSLILALIPFPTETFALSLDWAARYDGPGSGRDGGQAITVDNSGNVYVAGSSTAGGTHPGDYLTIKYDPSGNEVWTARYGGPLDRYSYVREIVVDASGNAYVTGTVYHDASQYDCVTVKYGPSGNELWVARSDWDGFGDEGSAMALDGSGNLYVVGGSEKEPGPNWDVLAIKYDGATGDELWLRRYNGAGSEWDYGIAMALDGSSNVYVTGYSWLGHDDFVTIKYDSAGNEQWVRLYAGPGNGHDRSYAVVLDGGGNVYVTGSSIGSGTGSDFATIKYDPAGNELWVRRYDNPFNGYDSSYGIALDPSNNVYVTGQSEAAASVTDCTTIKYDTAGNELWVRHYDGPANGNDMGRDVVVDGAGRITVSGFSEGSGTDYDYLIIQYSPAGEELATARYDGPASDADRAWALTVDASDNIYVTGESVGVGTDNDFATVKYNPGDSPTLINDRIAAASGSDGCKDAPSDPIDPCTPDLDPGYPRFTLGPGPDDDLYEDYLTLKSISATAIAMPISTVLKILLPEPVRGANTDGGGDRPTTGYWLYSLADNDGTTSTDDTLDPDERVSRIWQFVDEGGGAFDFWVDVYTGGARASTRLASIEGSPGAETPEAGSSRAVEGFVLDDGTAEVHGGSTSGAFILANRFTTSTPIALEAVSFYTSGWAAGDEAAMIVYEDPFGTEAGPSPSMEVWRTTVTLESGGFQTVSTDGLVLNPAGVDGAAFYVAVANTAGRSYTLGVDRSGPGAGASFVSTDGGATFASLSTLTVLDGNAMIRAEVGPIEACFVGAVQ